MLKIDGAEFFKMLTREDGLSLNPLGLRYNGYTASKIILDKIGLNKKVQDECIELYHNYGDHCDCEILFNAKFKLLE